MALKYFIYTVIYTENLLKFEELFRITTIILVPCFDNYLFSLYIYYWVVRDLNSFK